ncbi:MAG TPA: bifunctional glutamate N-acetyltransferase/amino-acid acetyltransferase ArgJ [Candidatus Dormibacteraeota bacterium]|nr:bifunctional glutamate N-acetyltransferase/amino-acid acetyltransferase ArgJ [Candidatus Dormibacteraeota bacterium]
MDAVAASLDPLPLDLPSADRSAVLPAGFVAGGMAAGIKASGRPDLALVATTVGPVPAAAVFTPNPVGSAPVRWSRGRLPADPSAGGGRCGVASAVVSTSGSANAATGDAGDADQADIAAGVARALGVDVGSVLCLSTGVIGVRLPVPTVIRGIETLAPKLSAAPESLEAAARALMTTDSRSKLATASVELSAADGRTHAVRVSGIAKGVGMIHPRMATMLAVLMTDATVEPSTLSRILRLATASTWDQLTIDRDTSTNDTVFLLASGAAGAGTVRPGSAAERTLASAVTAVARDLARQQAADGEGATTLITCQVTGAIDDAEARAVAREVVASSLVKAAVHGRDPNWGRIAAAAGNARLAEAPVLVAAGLDRETAVSRAGVPATVDPARLRIAIAGRLVFDGASGPLPFDREAARADMDGPEVLIRVDLGLGSGSGEAFGCDLTEAYVVENSEYTT